MQPGLTRAVPLGILGLIVGMLFVIVLRALQSVNPVWDPQIAIVSCAFFVSFFFVWGMGAFDPRMNQHAHEPSEDDHGKALAEIHHIEEAPAQPTVVLGYSMWEIATWTTALLVVLFAFAFLGPSFIQTTGDPAASAAAVGFVPVKVPFSGDFITWNGEVVLFSKFTLLVIFVLFTLFSLALAGGAIAGTFFFLSRGVTESKSVSNTALALASGEVIQQKALASSDTRTNVISALKFIVAFVVLYLAFYYVLVGGLWLIFPSWANWLRVLLSFVNAALFALLITQPPFIMRPLGQGARWLATLLRRVSNEQQ